MVFYETFGFNGTASAFFGGQWWLVGILMIFIFVAFALAYRVNYEGIMVIMILGLVSASAYNIYFLFREDIVQTVIFITFIFIAYMGYNFFNK